MKYSRILSYRHFAYLTKRSFVDLKDIVFLVKDLVTQNSYFTQYHIPSAKPIKAYYHGFDITSFLTHRSHLTAYSYYFINYAYAIGFTILDVRAYFNGFVRASKLEPAIAKLKQRGLTGYKPRVTHEKAESSQSLADSTAQPMDTSTPGFAILQKMRDNRIPNSPLEKRLDVTAFKDSRIFSAAWKLSCCLALPFKFAETRLELAQRLKEAGLGDTALLAFKEYLFTLIPNLDEIRLIAMLNDTAKQFGWFRSNIITSDALNTSYSFTTNDCSTRGLRGRLMTVMFPPAYALY